MKFKINQGIQKNYGNFIGQKLNQKLLCNTFGEGGSRNSGSK